VHDVGRLLSAGIKMGCVARTVLYDERDIFWILDAEYSTYLGLDHFYSLCVLSSLFSVFSKSLRHHTAYCSKVRLELSAAGMSTSSERADPIRHRSRLSSFRRIDGIRILKTGGLKYSLPESIAPNSREKLKREHWLNGWTIHDKGSETVPEVARRPQSSILPGKRRVS
jgi:hypothetical protein